MMQAKYGSMEVLVTIRSKKSLQAHKIWPKAQKIGMNGPTIR